MSLSSVWSGNTSVSLALISAKSIPMPVRSSSSTSSTDAPGWQGSFQSNGVYTALGLAGAHSTEFDPTSPHPVIALLDAQRNVTQKGGTMRLGAQPCQLKAGSAAARLYGAFLIHERHRHRYEFNNAYRERFEAAGFEFSGTSPDGQLVEIIEVRGHPFFVASQFHPEFLSKPNAPHPLFRGFIAAAHAHMHRRPL